jgi:RNA polymerase sigma-70 factor (ECF subfamily)
VFNITGDDHLARDLAQDVFFEIWKKRETIQITSSLKSYLRRAVVNRSLNAIKAKRLDYNAPEKLPEKPHSYENAQEILEAQDLENLIHQTIDSLPEKCRMVFVLCRIEGFSHKEVSGKLGISPKTIENQMTKALKILRNVVQPHISKGLFWLFIPLFF